MVDEYETKNKEIEIEDDVGNEDAEVIPYLYSITSYGADYPVDGLVKRMREGNISIPKFQRGYVWSFTDASKFVESLLLGLPVPGIFLSKDEEQRLLVIDGQQRLRTLQYFYDGVFEPNRREFALKGVQSKYKGITYDALNDEDRRRLDDSIIHAVIVKQDEPSEDNSSVVHIFERLNTGGKLLHAQEIRACIYHGEFNDLLDLLNDNDNWRAIYGPPSARLRDEELILRFLALYFNYDAYKEPMKGFLNKFMGKNRHLKKVPGKDIKRVFENTVENVIKGLPEKPFRPKRALNAAVFDAVMVGLARRLKRGKIHNYEEAKAKYKTLLKEPDFITATESKTSYDMNVKMRIELATENFDPIA